MMTWPYIPTRYRALYRGFALTLGVLVFVALAATPAIAAGDDHAAGVEAAPAPAAAPAAAADEAAASADATTDASAETTAADDAEAKASDDDPGFDRSSEDVALDLPEEEKAADAPAKADAAPSNTESLTRLVFGLIVVVGAIFGVQQLIKRRRSNGLAGGTAAADDLIEVLNTTPLAPNRTLHLVRMGNEIVMVGATEQSINHIRTLDNDSTPFLNRVSDSSQFEQHMTKAFQQSTTPTEDDSFARRFVNNLKDITARE